MRLEYVSSWLRSSFHLCVCVRLSSITHKVRNNLPGHITIVTAEKQQLFKAHIAPVWRSPIQDVRAP